MSPIRTVCKCCVLRFKNLLKSTRSFKQTVAASYEASLAVVPSPSNASAPSVAYADLAGTYANGGYGDIDFCYVSDSSSCQSILSILSPDAVGEFSTLIAQWNKLWASHIRLEHFDGDIWNATLLDSRVSDCHCTRFLD